MAGEWALWLGSGLYGWEWAVWLGVGCMAGSGLYDVMPKTAVLTTRLLLCGSRN